MTTSKDTDYVTCMAANIYELLTDGPNYVHHGSATWLDQSGERLTMRINKADIRAQA